MLKIFKKSINSNNANKEETLVMIVSLLVHAAKIDENYTDKEKKIIINFLKSTDTEINFNEIMRKAEIEEKNSNQILKYTQEIKKNNPEFKKEIIETLWRLILSDNNPDIYENTLMRRIAGLLYIPDKLIGEIKLKVLSEKKT